MICDDGKKGFKMKKLKNGINKNKICKYSREK